MRRYSLLLALLAAPVFAQPPGVAPPDFARTVAPFVDEHTLVVVRVDVSRVDLDTVLKVAAAIVPDEVLGEEPGPTVARFVQGLTERAGNDVFLTYGPSDFPHPPTLLARAPAGDEARLEVAQILSQPYKLAGINVDWAVIHGCVAVGTKDALATLKARKPVERPDLMAALDAGANGVAQVAFAPSAEGRKIFEQVSPTLPAELGGGGIQKVTRGLKWSALVIGPGPKMPTRWITECASPEAAQDLMEIERRARRAVGGELAPGAGKPAATLFDNARTTQEGTRITTEWELGTNLLAAVQHPARLPAERARSANNLKQLLIALHNYHDAYGHFPTDITDKDGKPLLSWRVAILPYVEHDNLYRQFKPDEPWDSEHNKKLIAQMPKVFRSPRQAAGLKDRTTYLAPLGPGLMWDEPKGLKITAISDGTSNTIALVEADDDRAVEWSKPEDITITPRDPAAGLLGHYGDGFQAAMADGSVRFINKGIDPKALWALFTRAGGEVVGGK